jgi:hypothetical protein
MTSAVQNHISSTTFSVELRILSTVSGLQTRTDKRTDIASPAFHFVGIVQRMYRNFFFQNVF